MLKKAKDKIANSKRNIGKQRISIKAINEKNISISEKSIDELDSTPKNSINKNSIKKNSPKSTNILKKLVVPIPEYYDLPYKYGNTLIRLLAQTPNTLFVYWEISDFDTENLKKLYGDDFFYKTKPILIVHNLTLNKHYEIEINDFANCWYINTEDANCKFDVELARKLINPSPTHQSTLYEQDITASRPINSSSIYTSNNSSDNSLQNTSKCIPEYINITKSNDLCSPNDHILFEKLQEFVVFRDAKTGDVTRRRIKSFKFLEDIYKFYKEMYAEEIEKNPSSQYFTKGR